MCAQKGVTQVVYCFCFEQTVRCWQLVQHALVQLIRQVHQYLQLVHCHINTEDKPTTTAHLEHFGVVTAALRYVSTSLQKQKDFTQCTACT
eukprot:17642-Heterococcus_DN1.PRE.2